MHAWRLEDIRIKKYPSKDKMAKRIAITGLGPISSLGIGCAETWDSILHKRLNIARNKYFIDNEKWDEFYLHKIKRFDIQDFDLPKENFEFIKEIRTVTKEDTDLYYFLAIIKLAIEDSGLKYDRDRNDVGLILTQENAGVEIFFEELIDSAYEIFNNLKHVGSKEASKLRLAQKIYENGAEKRGYNLQTFTYLFSAAKVFDLHGYSLFINNACASGLFAIEAAAQQIRAGTSPAVVVAACDDPTRVYKYLWFKKNKLYSEDGIARPFSNDSNGIVFGDGGAALVLEDLEHAMERKARIYAEYLGGGFSLEGWKITVPNVADDFYTRSFKKALYNSMLRSDDIDFVNPHGVGMKVTDTYEANTINNIFKEKKPSVSAFKPLVGHNLGGSALLETAISLLALKNNMIPATLNCENQNTKLSLNIVKENKKMEISTVAKMSCGFSGFNGVCIFRRYK